DGIPDMAIPLVNVSPVSCSLIVGTLSPGQGTGLGPTANTAFGPACCGGAGALIATTTVTAGDNNIFGGFTRAASCTIALGTRAPVVLSVTPVSGNCGAGQDLIITGGCFITETRGAPTVNVTSVYAMDRVTGAVINATGVILLGPTQ